LKKLERLTPARCVISAIEVASKPCSRNSSQAASASVSREEAFGRPTRPARPSDEAGVLLGMCPH
jgi:hypothetical protein